MTYRSSGMRYRTRLGFDREASTQEMAKMWCHICQQATASTQRKKEAVLKTSAGAVSMPCHATPCLASLHIVRNYFPPPTWLVLLTRHVMKIARNISATATIDCDKNTRNSILNRHPFRLQAFFSISWLADRLTLWSPTRCGGLNKNVERIYLFRDCIGTLGPSNRWRRRAHCFLPLDGPETASMPSQCRRFHTGTSCCHFAAREYPWCRRH